MHWLDVLQFHTAEVSVSIRHLAGCSIYSNTNWILGPSVPVEQLDGMVIKKYANTEAEKYKIVSKQCSTYVYIAWWVLNLWNKLNFLSFSPSTFLFLTLVLALSLSYHECYIIAPKRWLDFGPYLMPYGPDTVIPSCPKSVQLTVTVLCKNCEENQHLLSKFNLSLEPKVAKFWEFKCRGSRWQLLNIYWVSCLFFFPKSTVSTPKTWIKGNI